MLLLLYSPGSGDQVNEPIAGRTRLVKMLFLFRQEALSHFKKGTELSEENFYRFFPWNFGPFSSDVYRDLEFFTLRGFVASSASEEEALPESAAEWDRWMSDLDAQDVETDEYEEENFQLTSAGATFVQKRLWSLLSDAQRGFLRQFKNRTARVPLRALLRYVYEKYPDFITKSVIREEVIGS